MIVALPTTSMGTIWPSLNQIWIPGQRPNAGKRSSEGITLAPPVRQLFVSQLSSDDEMNSPEIRLMPRS